ncbi:acyltransferase GLAUCE-like [Aristolochia californica]|uniref:acyltransferase GLAUCE-like n=1 Tax=Aristolochia californica TaxID=171875 RepID=UPI0035E1086B
MEHTYLVSENDVVKEDPVILTSPKNPTPIRTVFLSNLDQTVAFPVETIYFYEALSNGRASGSDVVESLKNAVSRVLLIPYYFMAGRLRVSPETQTLELVCNNAGIHLVSATSNLRVKDLGNVSLPNPSFQHLLLRTDGFRSFTETPLLTIQVTRFKCGGSSVGFATNHSILDGKSAFDFFDNLASICRGEGLKTHVLNNDRTCFKARNPPQITYPHKEYMSITEMASATSSSFTSSNQPFLSPSLLKLKEHQSYKLFHFTSTMLQNLKQKASTKCSTFEAIVSHIWRVRAKAVFEDPNQTSSVLFAVDIRSKTSPTVPHGFIGNAVITACATAKVLELEENPFSFCVEKVKEAIESITDDYVRSVIDWLEVHKGFPATCNGNFYVSAWWRLPFYELDLGYGKPIYGGPVVSGMDEFVLLLSEKKKLELQGGINVWIVLEKKKMERFVNHVFEI